MSKDKRVILTEAMVHSATALGIHIVKEIATATLARQPSIPLSQFIGILEQHEARIKASQKVKTTIVDEPETPDVIHL